MRGDELEVDIVLFEQYFDCMLTLVVQYLVYRFEMQAGEIVVYFCL